MASKSAKTQEQRDHEEINRLMKKHKPTAKDKARIRELSAVIKHNYCESMRGKVDPFIYDLYFGPDAR